MVYTLIIANGDLNDGEAVQAALRLPFDIPHLIIAADGGLRHLSGLHLTPNLVIGDMDSADPAQLAEAERNGLAASRIGGAVNPLLGWQTAMHLQMLVSDDGCGVFQRIQQNQRETLA